MMYYRRALQLQAFFDAATPQQIEEGYLSITQAADDLKKNQRSMWAHINAVADMKFTYVAACQIYGTQKRKNQKEAVDIFDLMKK
jgi:callose synthase